MVPPAAASADELIVDNSDPLVQVSGAWATNSQGDGFVGSNYLTLPANTANASMFWPVPSSLTPGHYQVFARWTGGSGHAAAAAYHIQYDGGALDVRKDQRSNGGDWQLLGDFDFQSGQSEGVSLSTQSDGTLVADAIRFVTAAPSATPAPVAAPAATPVSILLATFVASFAKLGARRFVAFRPVVFPA